MVATGWPLTRTRGTGAVGMAWPPCAHRTLAPRCRIGPGMVQGPLGWRRRQTIVSAPMLMLTAGVVERLDLRRQRWNRSERRIERRDVGNGDRQDGLADRLLGEDDRQRLSLLFESALGGPRG